MRLHNQKTKASCWLQVYDVPEFFACEARLVEGGLERGEFR